MKKSKAKMAYAKPMRNKARGKQTGKQQKVSRTMAKGLPAGKRGWAESQTGKPKGGGGGHDVNGMHVHVHMHREN